MTQTDLIRTVAKGSYRAASKAARRFIEEAISRSFDLLDISLHSVYPMVSSIARWAFTSRFCLPLQPRAILPAPISHLARRSSSRRIWKSSNPS